jgi:hypothetical protein
MPQIFRFSNIHNDRSFAPFLHEDFDFAGRYDHVDSVEDLPTAFYFEEMLQQYSDAKFILTVREPEEWYRSFSAHHVDMLELYGGSMPFRVRSLNELVYGSADDDKDTWIAHYIAHNDRVISTIPEEQLLVLDLTQGDGWYPLCSFLKISSGPCEDMKSPFPHDNSKADRQAAIDQRAESEIEWTPAAHGLHSQYAYASLLAFPSSPEHREYFISFLVAAESIRRTGSQQDIVALVYGHLSQDDEELLRIQNIRSVRVGPVGTNLPSNPEAFDDNAAIIYRAKIRVLQMIEYEMVLFFDSDVIFTELMDHLFATDKDFVGRVGNDSPLNAGLFLIRPSWQAFVDINDVAMTAQFSVQDGWLEYGV